ncbi:MAG: ABC transporter substrate-binding protein [Gammaproteobacteria bacterium]|nr:ABC transporter substrate-binding protein [Gammaproteobacteria bacterium]
MNVLKPETPLPGLVPLFLSVFRWFRLTLIFQILFILPLILTPSLCFSAEKPAENITIQLKWLHQFQFAGYYAAIEKGFYADEGLNVELRQRNLATSHSDDVLKGRAQYGTADSGLILPLLQGKPVVLLAQIFQQSPLIFLTREDSGIEVPKDLAGKQIGIDIQGHGDQPLIALLLETFGSFDAVKVQKHSGDFHDLLDGKIQAQAGYITNEPYWFYENNTAVNIINPRDYGIDFYGDNLFTTEKELREHPERVVKVRRATLKGWQYALANREEIIELILQKYNTQGLSRNHLAYQARETEKLILPDLIEMGTFDSLRYQKIANTYVDAGFV